MHAPLTVLRSRPRRLVALLALAALLTSVLVGGAPAADAGEPLEPGVPWAWGNNVTGQLGDGSFTGRRTPVPERG